jgi:hypothetical protein
VELGREDWSLAIILGAMSVECELAYLYSKWKALDADLAPHEVKPSLRESWETEFDKLWSISGKLDAVSKLLTGHGFDFFVSHKPDVLSTPQQTYSHLEVSPKDFFIQALFWKRNKILHSGKVQFGKAEAETCVKVALNMIQIMRLMDKDRGVRFVSQLTAPHR